jgi:hypothetical protein
VVEKVALGLNKDVQRYGRFAYRGKMFYFTYLNASGTLTKALVIGRGIKSVTQQVFLKMFIRG